MGVSRGAMTYALKDIEKYLRDVVTRKCDTRIESQIEASLKDLKHQAVEVGDQDTAKGIWCFEKSWLFRPITSRSFDF